MNKNIYDLIIIGGGPAGLTAGLYARRGGLKTMIIESIVAGGQTNLTGEIENYPGFMSVSGFDLSAKMLEQCESIGVDVVYGEVSSLQLNETIKEVSIDNEIYNTKAVILAMGASPRKMGIAKEEAYIGGGVSYCAHCDGNFFKGKDVAVVGGGNTALQDALYLSNICNKVYLIHRRDEFRGNKILSDKLYDKSNIVMKLNCVPNDIDGKFKVDTLQIKNKVTQDTENLNVSGVFVAVGMIPNSDLIKGKIQTDEQGFIVTDENMQTNVNLVYAVGDIRQKPLRQVVTACADGAVASNDIISKIS